MLPTSEDKKTADVGMLVTRGAHHRLQCRGALSGTSYLSAHQTACAPAQHNARIEFCAHAYKLCSLKAMVECQCPVAAYLQDTGQTYQAAS